MSIFKLKTKNLVTWIVLLAIVLIPATKALAGFSPSRPTFTWASPATYVTFNSITDNPYVGDERTFLDAKDLATGIYHDSNAVTDNEELMLTAYYHNNAASNLNLVAHNTRVRFALPSGSGTSQQVIGYISADNANPGTVTDTTDFTSAQPFTLEYEAGTAKLRTNALNDVALSDSIVSGGTQIGYNAINGEIPGCSEFSGWVTIKVRVHIQTPPPPAPVYSCDLLTLVALPNRRVDAYVDYTALNGASLTNVSYNWGDVTPLFISDDYANHTYASDGTYTVTATTNFNVGGVAKTANCTKSVTITTTPVTTPVYSCDLLNVTVSPNRKIDASVTYTAAGGATLKDISFNWGDGSAALNNGKNTSASYTYQKDGTYTITTNLRFIVPYSAGYLVPAYTTKTATCTKTITITTPITPGVTPPVTPAVATPGKGASTLPNTGPGSVAGLFAGVSAFAGSVHYFVTRRKFGQ